MAFLILNCLGIFAAVALGLYLARLVLHRGLREHQALSDNEARLRQSEERLRLAVTGACLGTWHWDIIARELEFSDAALLLCGLPPGSPMSQEIFLALLRADDRDNAYAAVRNALAERSGYEFEFRVIWPDATERWLAVRGHAYDGPHGSPVRMEGIAFDITGRKHAEARVHYLAYYDSLTGLANRTLFQERLMQFLHAAERGQRSFALCVVDLDHFKNFNDALGRQIGDVLLVQFANRLLGTVESPEHVARLGSDHFAVLLPRARSEARLIEAIERTIEQCTAQPYHLAEAELHIAVKQGVALFPEDGGDADTLFRNAEAALKKAKAAGERYLFYTHDMTERIGERVALESRLRRALENEEFVLYYQPKVDAVVRSITGVEALIRWQDPQAGLVPPMTFIPLLEGTGMIPDVGAWAIRRAIEDQAFWAGRGIAAPRVAVNVSAVQLRRRDFVDVVRAAVAGGSGVSALDLEITETVIMGDIEANVGKLRALHSLGMNIAIDDFGTGYSSLGYLARLPVQVLKIDVTFIGRMLNDAGIMTLVVTMISLAHSLGLTVVAEGVETEEQAAALQTLGCDELQGYLIQHPLPREEMAELLLRMSRGESREQALH